MEFFSSGIAKHPRGMGMRIDKKLELLLPYESMKLKATIIRPEACKVKSVKVKWLAH